MKRARLRLTISLSLCVAFACGDDAATPSGPNVDDGGVVGPGADASNDGANGADGAAGNDGALPTGDGSPGDSSVPPPPPPVAVCPVVAAAATAGAIVVGDGTAASCTEAALRTAVTQGGVITFSCGAAPHTITIATQLAVSKAKDTVIDGGGTITLDGQNTSRILFLDRQDFPKKDPTLTLQNLTLRRGKSSVGTGNDDGSGAAVFLPSGGSLTVVGTTFVDNHTPDVGQEVGGGAIFVNGAGDVVVGSSTFSQNSGSNGGAIGIRGASLTVVSSAFSENYATGNGGNPGNGGNGGAIVIDGQGKKVHVCGSRFVSNNAGAHGGAMFRTGYETEENTIERSEFRTNHGDENGSSLYLQGVAVVVRESAITGSTGGSAVFLANHGAVSETARFVNVTFAGNDVGTGLGAAIADNGITSTSLENVTMVGNRGQFDVAVHGGATMTMKNSIVTGQVGSNVANPNNPLACGRFESGTFNHPFAGGSNNLQWPQAKGGGFNDNPCVTGITFSDPKLGVLSEVSGTMVARPQVGSPALGAGVDCPAVDQLGNARPDAGCTLGAVQ